MKKQVLLFLCYIFLLVKVFSQDNYFPNYDDQPIWIISSQGLGGSLTETIRSVEEVFIDGNQWVRVKTDDDLDIGWYRVNGPRVFFTFDLRTREYLIYDFSLEEGDSIYLEFPIIELELSDSILFKVIQTDTICFGNIPRKTITIDAQVGVPGDWQNFFYHRTSWIVGIGDFLYPFPTTICIGASNCEASYLVECLETNTGITYSSGREASCLYPISNPHRIYVNFRTSTLPRIQNGQSWETAFTDLQDAIAIAQAGDTIWVAEGTYRPTKDGNREISFELKQGVVLLGGFEGYECFEWERNPDLYETILSGDIGQKNLLTDNSYHVLYTIGTDKTTLIDGFTIRDGYAIHENSSYFGSLVWGGGLLVDANDNSPVTELRIQNCRFLRNMARYGGGISCRGQVEGFTSPIISDCYFYQNIAKDEGGAFYKTGSGNPSIPQLFKNCVFEDNNARSGGGAVALINACDQYLFENCTFLRDTTFEGGGAIYYLTDCDNGEVRIDKCHFEGNEGTNGGAFGFLYTGFLGNTKYVFKTSNSIFTRNSSRNDNGGAVFYFMRGDTAQIKFEDCQFLNNLALFKGGAIYISINSYATSLFEVSSCQFYGNNAIQSLGDGAIAIKGELTDKVTRSHTSIQNSLFYNNQGAFGLASGFRGVATAMITNSTFYQNGRFPFAKNWSPNFDSTFSASMDFANCIIWEPDTPLQNIFFNGNPDNQNLYNYAFDNCLISPNNCDMLGGEEACGENMFFNTPPLFIAPENGDFSLAACSPAIDQGNNAFPQEQILNTDLKGDERIQGNFVDIGAYEQPIYTIQTQAIEAASCHDSADGKVIFALNGTAPHHFSWENELGETGSNTSDLAGGTYSFSITDNLGCEDSVIISIPVPASIQPDYDIMPVSEAGINNGKIELTGITGGVTPYSFLWNTGSTSPSLFNLAPGDYVLTITDGNDCIFQDTFTVSIINNTGFLDKIDAISIAPNPVKSGNSIQLLYQGDAVQNMNGTLFDVSGKLIQQFTWTVNLKNDLYHLSTQKLIPGLYFLKLISEKGEIGFKKIVVQ